MDPYDVIIVGAGPAGSRPARLLAEAGCKVLVLEKARLPRYKPCAGGLTGRAMVEADINLDGVVDRWVDGTRCRLDDRRQIEVAREDQRPVAMVMRDRFDQALAEAAVAAGADLKDGVKVLAVREKTSWVECETTMGTVTASCLIGADGAVSRVAECLGLRVKTRLHPALEGEFYPPRGEIVPDFRNLALYDFGIIPGGYAWIFPKGAHYSVGICSTYRRIRKIKPYFEAFVNSHDCLRRCTTRRIRGWVIPLGTSGGRITTKRCLLTGDAAGCVDPITGEGISYALRSGALAAKVIAKGLDSGNDLNLPAYQKAMEDEIYGDLRLGRWFAKLCYLCPRLSFRVFFKDPRVVHHFFEIMAGKKSYRDILNLALKNWWRLRLN